MSYEDHLRFGRGILEHRYRYYRLNEAVLMDAQYDLIEALYIADVPEFGDPLGISTMVDFPDTEECIAAGKRVDRWQDCWGSWFKEMLPVWDKLGPPDDMKEFYKEYRKSNVYLVP